MIVALVVIAVASASAPIGDKPRVAVLDFATSGLDEESGRVFAQAIASQLFGTGRYEAISRQDVATLLRAESDRTLLGAANPGAMQRIAALLEARFLAGGTLRRVGNDLFVSAELMDTARASIVGRVARRYDTFADALAAVAAIVDGLLVEPALLQLYNQVPGVQLLLDDQLLGEMPVRTLAIPHAGVHRLRTESSEYLPWEETVTLSAGKTTRLRVTLDRIEDVERLAARRRATGIALIVVGASVAVGSAAAFYGAVDTKRIYDRLDASETEQRRFDALALQGHALFAAGYGMLALGVAGVAVGAVLVALNPHSERLRLRFGAAELRPALSPLGGGIFGSF